MNATDQALQRIAAAVNGLQATVRNMRGVHQRLEQEILLLRQRPRTITEEIDQIPGRRIEYVLDAETSFTASDEGNRGQPLTFTVSQDGPFIMTHYPQAIWRPSAPGTATNLGRWRPVSTFPLPDQVVDTDIIDLMYEMQDGGNSRNFQNGPRGPIFSRPDNMVPLPVPTMFAPNATIQFFPTYNSITWDASTPPTAGILHVDLIGYRIVNL
jgi:hypothetical protein